MGCRPDRPHAPLTGAGADACFDVPFEWQAVSRKLHQLLERATPDPLRILVVEDERVIARSQSLTYSPRSTSFKALRIGTSRSLMRPSSTTGSVNEPSARTCSSYFFCS